MPLFSSEVIRARRVELTWDVPFFRKELYSMALSDAVKPKVVAIGKDETGQFRAARHKEYPRQFCRAFAQQFDRFLRAGRVRPESAMLEDLEKWITQAVKISAVIRADAQWLPDCQDL